VLSRSAIRPLLSFLLLGVLLPQAALATQLWSRRAVDESGAEFGHNATSVALDAAGLPSFSYYVATTLDLKYAEKDANGIWTRTTVDSTGRVGLWNSLALDALGNPHISYFHQNNEVELPVADLKYATRSGGVWTIEIVDGAGLPYLGEYTSIALDSQGDPHISYYDNDGQALKYAHKSNGSWTLEVVDSASNAGLYTSIVVDASDVPHIAYQVRDVAVRYATKTGGNWSIETASPGVQGIDVSLALDSGGTPYIVFFDDQDTEHLRKTRIATRSGATWTTSIAKALGADIVGRFTRLAIDSNDMRHMIFFSESIFLLTNNFVYATFDGSFWVPQPIETDGKWGSLVLDATNNPHVAYNNPTETQAKYAVYSDVVSDSGFEPRPGLVAMNVFPNPVRTSTTLILRSPTALPVSLVLLDARGRVVRSIGERTLRPGTNEFSWDGRDNAGHAVGAGIYFAVVRPERLGVARKVLVLR
jgi:hypothetical protein